MTTTPRPPRLAVVLLTRFLPDNEPLIGDLLEEFQLRRSRVWFWRQVLVAIVIGRLQERRRPVRPLRLTDEPDPVVREELHLPVNLSASPLPSAGGLGLVALATLVAIVRPEAWWFVLAAVIGGIVFGIIRIVRTRRRFLADPPTFLAGHGFDNRR